MDKSYDQNNNLVYAENLNTLHKGIKYKCYNSKCTGEFLFKNGTSNYKKACFYYDARHHDKYGNSLTPHIKDCWCLSSNNSSSYESDSFDLDNFINNLNTSAPNTTTKTPPTTTTIIDTTPSNDNDSADTPIKINTLLRLYRFCKCNDPESYIGNKKVKDLYVYSQTLDYYKSNQINSTDYHLFLLDRVIKKADYENYSFQAKCSTNDKLFTLFSIKFSNKDLFTQAYYSFFKNKSGTKLEDSKIKFLVLAKPGECTPIGATSYLIQTLHVDNLKFIHLL